MRHRRCQLDMSHALTPHFRQRDLDTALLADDTAILHPLVLAAQAFIVTHRTKDAGTEQPVFFRLEGTIVDGSGLLDLAKGSRPDPLRRRNRNTELVKALRALVLPERVHQIVHLVISQLELVSTGSGRVTRYRGAVSTPPRAGQHSDPTSAVP